MCDEPLKCSICYDETSEENPILKCENENCGVCAHVLCYGITNKKSFKCSPCTDNISNESVFCALCEKPGVAMKKTTKPGKWVHVICVFFTKNAEFLCDESMEPINIERVRLSNKTPCIFLW